MRTPLIVLAVLCCFPSWASEPGRFSAMLRQTLFVAIMVSLLFSTMVFSQTGQADGDVTWDLGIEVPGQEKPFDRITGKASVISGSRLSFPDGCKVRLYGVETPKPDEPFGKEAAEFLGSLIKDQVISCIIQDSAGASCHAGETNLSETMLIHGWGKALHDSLVPAEIIAIDHKRGIWRGTLAEPEDKNKGEPPQSE